MWGCRGGGRMYGAVDGSHNCMCGAVGEGAICVGL